MGRAAPMMCFVSAAEELFNGNRLMEPMMITIAFPRKSDAYSDACPLLDWMRANLKNRCYCYYMCWGKVTSEPFPFISEGFKRLSLPCDQNGNRFITFALESDEDAFLMKLRFNEVPLESNNLLWRSLDVGNLDFARIEHHIVVETGIEL